MNNNRILPKRAKKQVVFESSSDSKFIHNYSCAMLNLSDELSTIIKKWTTENIPSDCLYINLDDGTLFHLEQKCPALSFFRFRIQNSNSFYVTCNRIKKYQFVLVIFRSISDLELIGWLQLLFCGGLYQLFIFLSCSEKPQLSAGIKIPFHFDRYQSQITETRLDFFDADEICEKWRNFLNKLKIIF